MDDELQANPKTGESSSSSLKKVKAQEGGDLLAQQGKVWEEESWAIKGHDFLEGYSSGALLLNELGSVISSNTKGAGLVSLVEQGAISEITELFTQAVSTGVIVSQPVALENVKGEVLINITIVPEVWGGLYLVIIRDLTMERNLRTALVESRQRYKDLVDVSSDFSWEVNAEGDFCFVTPKGAIGYVADELIDQQAEQYVYDPEYFSPLPFLTKTPIENIEVWLRKKDGVNSCMVLSAVPLISIEDGQEVWKGARGICRDVTVERDGESALARARHREQLLSYIVSSIRDELEPENMLSAAAVAAARALGVSGCRIYRKSVDENFVIAAEYGNVQDLDDINEQLIEIGKSRNTEQFEIGEWSVLAATTSYRQSVNGAIIIWKNVRQGKWEDDNQLMIGDVANQLGIANEQISNHERIVALSRTDSMTSLLNRRAFYEEELPRRISRLARSQKTAALFFIDMDNFKLVNDIHGHQAGDDAIMLLRDVMIEFSRPGDAIARLGGDEFALWLDGISEEVALERAATLITTSKKLKPYSGNLESPLGISVGVAIYDPKTNESLESLVSRADGAMYEIKKAGKGGYRFATPVGREDN